VLRVVNIDSMLRFYCEVLGCTVERRQDESGLGQLRAGRPIVDLVPVEGKLGRAGGGTPAGKDATWIASAAQGATRRLMVPL